MDTQLFEIFANYHLNGSGLYSSSKLRQEQTVIIFKRFRSNVKIVLDSFTTLPVEGNDSFLPTFTLKPDGTSRLGFLGNPGRDHHIRHLELGNFPQPGACL